MFVPVRILPLPPNNGDGGWRSGDKVFPERKPNFGLAGKVAATTLLGTGGWQHPGTLHRLLRTTPQSGGTNGSALFAPSCRLAP